ncbi:MAG TPA: carboxypeptidase regulatory-like domain-containing protein [Candidatus Eremiobacteraceae bacterium]|nr:carboxypeptidase regulatory-like domain-containing protein [Candidatus Eremiobacteraceae bacterium]
MSNRRCAVFAVLAFVLLALALASASITGSISGVVTDKSGAVISGASVAATDTLTGVQTTQKTDAKGFYNLPTLAVGTYNLEITQVGFKTYRQTGLVIDANSALRVDASLAVGSINEKIEVSTEAAQVETQSTQMGEVIEGTKMTSVPLNGRNFIDLLALQPGVSPYQCTSTNCNDTTNGVGVDPTTVSGDQTNGTQSVNGGRLGSNGFMVNGADAQEGVHNGAAILPNLDSISEFRIITNNFNAEYGNFSGGQINVVTKSGTNRFHGALFDFLRNTDFDAANYFAGGTRGDFKQNQFGGTIGGPIKKDKVFFFGDYQGNRQILGQTQSFAVPTAQDRTGNLIDEAGAFAQAVESGTGIVAATPANPSPRYPFGSWDYILSHELGYPVTPGEPYYYTAASDPYAPAGSGVDCTTSTGAAPCVFPNAVIPMSAWSPVAKATLKYIPTPNANLPSGANYEASSFNQHLRDDKFGIRLDTNTQYGTLFGYYFFDQFNVTTPYAQGITFPGFDSSVQGRAEMINLGLTTTINNSTVNDVRLVYLRNRYFGGIPIGGTGVPLSSLGFNTPWNSTGGIGPISAALEGVPSFVFNNYNFGLPQDALRQFNNTYQIIDNFTKIVGTHTLQFGGDFHYDQINERNYDDANGAYTFDGSETGLDFADFLIGAPVNFTQASQQLLDSRDKYFGIYAQDSWRARPTLTINYGLRYEIMTPWYDTQNKLETVIAGEQSQVFPTAPKGLVVPGDRGVPRTLAPIQYSNFAPRIGFAYSPDNTEGFLGKLSGGPGKSSIRAGYGIFYSAIEDATGFVEVGDAPYGLYYSSPEPTLLASPFIDRGTGFSEVSAGPKFPFTFPPKNISPKNPDTSFNWTQATPISGSDYLYPRDKIPRVQEFEFSLERQLGSSTVASVSYVGSVGRHLLTFEDSNPGSASLCLSLNALLPTGATPCGPFGEDNTYILAPGKTINSPNAVTVGNTTTVYGTRPTFGINFGSNPYMITAVSSSFNSLQASLKHNQKYANFLVAYTYEKSIDNGSSSFDATNPFNPRASRALSAFDVPQDLTVSYTVQMPFERLTGGSLKRLTTGWALSGIAIFAKGEPVQITEPSDDLSLSGTFADTIDEPSYANNGGHLFVNRNPRSGQPYFNPNYFTAEQPGQVGNAMRRFFSGPGINNFDMALLKDTRITESTQVQFRAEAFNIFNHAQFINPSGNFNNAVSGGFGYVTSARDPRVMQLALKFLF